MVAEQEETTPEQERALIEEAADAVPVLEIRWGHCFSVREVADEQWEGAFKTREEAIADGKEKYEDSFWIASGPLCDPAKFLPHIDHIIEWMADSATVEVGEVANLWPPVTPESVNALMEFMKGWARKYFPCPFWTPKGPFERIDT